MVQVAILKPVSAENWGIPVSFDDDEAAAIYARSVYIALGGPDDEGVLIGVKRGTSDYEIDARYYRSFRYLFPDVS